MPRGGDDPEDLEDMLLQEIAPASPEEIWKEMALEYRSMPEELRWKNKAYDPEDIQAGSFSYRDRDFFIHIRTDYPNSGNAPQMVYKGIIIATEIEGQDLPIFSTEEIPKFEAPFDMYLHKAPYKSPATGDFFPGEIILGENYAQTIRDAFIRYLEEGKWAPSREIRDV